MYMYLIGLKLDEFITISINIVTLYVSKKIKSRITTNTST